MAKTSLIFKLFIPCLLLAQPAYAGGGWFDRHAEGWFWYERSLEKQPDQPELPALPKTLTADSLSSAWLRNNMSRFLDKAIDHPSRENVSTYLYLDRAVKDKAERFAVVGKRVIESDPMLDENVRRPISPAAARIKDEQAYNAKEKVLKKIARMAGLVFYYQGNCPLCHLQAKTISLLSTAYGFMLIPISTDGQFIPQLPESRMEHPPSALNILTYPALFLMKPPNDIVLIRQGATSLTALTERLVDVAYQQRWINKNDYQNARISNEIQHVPEYIKQTFDEKSDFLNPIKYGVNRYE